MRPFVRVWFASLVLLLVGALPGWAVATPGPIHPDVSEATAALGRARGPEAITALRDLWQTWDRADPSVVEAALRVAAEDPKLAPQYRAYAALLGSYARRRRGDIVGAKAAVAELGFIADWLYVGPFDNENKAGFDTPFQPEQELGEAIVFGRAFDGKQRLVRYRSGRAKESYGWFDLGDRFRPREEACGYATSFLRLDDAEQGPRPITLFVGSSGAFKLFFNGEEVLADSAYRSFDVDRFATGVTLGTGVNRITIKVCGDEEAPMFSVRVADVRGGPTTGIRLSSDVLLSEEPLPENAAPSGPGDVLGPIQAFERRTADNPGAAELEAYARYLVATGGDPKSEHTARDLARRAAEMAPTKERLLLAGQLSEDRNQWRAWVTKARDLAGEDVDVLLAEAALARTGANWRDAVPVFERILEVEPDHVPATLGLVELYVRADLPRTALVTIERAVDRQPHAVGLLRVLAAQLRAVGRDQEAAQVEARYASRRFDDVGFLHDQVELAVARRDAEGAERWLDRLLATEPDPSWGFGVAARTYRALGQPDRARAAYLEALEVAPEDLGTLRALADLHGLQGRPEEQLTLLRKILTIHPQATDVREYVEHIEPPKPRMDEAYAWDAERFLPLRDDPADGQIRRVLRRVNVTTVFPNGLASRFHQEVFQPLTDEAAAQAREYGFQYEGSDQIVQLRAARVYRADGRVDEAIEYGEAAANDPSIAMYTSVRNFYVRFPRLEVGDVVEIRYRIEDVAVRNERGDYFGEVEYLQGSDPIGSSEYVLITPKERSFHMALNGLDGVARTVEEAGESRVYRYHATDVPALEPEPAMPPWAEVAAHVHVSTFETWDEVGAWYWGLVKDQFDVDDEVRKVAAEVTRGLTTDEEKVAAVYAYATELRYVALEFGIEGILPRRCALTLARGWGDCKDKATLIVTMLRELGIDSTIVLVRTGMRGDSEDAPASLAPFDHAIAYVPSLDLYLDGTAEGHGMGELPAMDRGAFSLQINQGAPKLVRIPHPPADASVSERKVEARIAADGSARVQAEFHVKGVNAPQFRRRYNSEATRRERLTRDLSTWLGSFVIADGNTSVKVSDLDDIETPVDVRAEGRVDAYARPEGDLLSAAIATGPGLSSAYAGLSSRTYDVLLGALRTQVETRRLVLPPGYKVVSAPASGSQKTPFGNFDVQVEIKAGEVIVHSRLELTRARIEPGEYAAFAAFCDAADQAFGQRVLLGR